MKIREIMNALEDFAPLAYQESYDNCGLQVGDKEQETNSALLCLDITEAVVDEAIALSCNLIISHHPLIFFGLKSITGKNDVERIITKAIQNKIAIYSAHTNLDNVFQGVNNKIAEKLHLINRKILSPTANNLLKLHTYVPSEYFNSLSQSLFEAGAGQIGNYEECGYSWLGKGTFKPKEGSHPEIGKAGGKREEVEEIKLEVILPDFMKTKILKTLFENHPYEEVAYGFIKLSNENQHIGAGMIGDLAHPCEIGFFLESLKENMKTTCIRHTALNKTSVQKIAVCGGSGSFLLADAIRQKADVYITADFKYHQFFDAENKIMIADIGHYESEQFTIEIFSEIIIKKFPNFATLFTKINTNPVNYYF